MALKLMKNSLYIYCNDFEIYREFFHDDNNFIVYKNLKNIKWSKILLRKVRFLFIPPYEALTSKEDRAKRFFIRILHLNCRKRIFKNIAKDFFYNKKCLFTEGDHARNLMAFHFPQFSVFNFPGGANWFSILKQLPVDKSAKIFVFTFVLQENILKALRKKFPNSKIYIRLHDMICEYGFWVDKVFNVKDYLKKYSKSI